MQRRGVTWRNYVTWERIFERGTSCDGDHTKNESRELRVDRIFILLEKTSEKKDTSRGYEIYLSCNCEINPSLSRLGLLKTNLLGRSDWQFVFRLLGLCKF